MENFKQKNGSDKTVGLDAIEKINLKSGEPFHFDLSCLRCHLKRIGIFEDQMEKFAQLPKEERLEKLIVYRHQLDVRNSIDHHDYVGTLDIMIAFLNDEIENELKFKEDKQKSDDTANKLIHAGIHKLELDIDEGELAEIIGEFFYMTMNKKGNHLFVDERTKLTDWICEVISLKNGQPLVHSTIVNRLPSKLEINKKFEKKRLNES